MIIIHNRPNTLFTKCFKNARRMFCKCSTHSCTGGFVWAAIWVKKVSQNRERSHKTEKGLTKQRKVSKDLKTRNRCQQQRRVSKAEEGLDSGPFSVSLFLRPFWPKWLPIVLELKISAGQQGCPCPFYNNFLPE